MTRKDAFLIGYTHGTRDLRRLIPNPYKVGTIERKRWHQAFILGRKLGSHHRIIANKMAEALEIEREAS